MAKKRRKDAENRGAAPAAGAAPSSVASTAVKGGGIAHRYWFLAIALIVSGYFSLRYVDPAGANLWGIVSPALLLGGYLAIIPAILATYRSK